MQHRRLSERATQLVSRRDDEVGPVGQRTRRQVGVEPQVGSPCLVDDEGDSRGVGHGGDRRDIRDEAEVARAHDVHSSGHLPHRSESRELLRDRVGGQRLRRAERAVNDRSNEATAHPGHHEPVDHGGVDRALHEQGVTECSQRHDSHVVALGCAVGEEPGAAGAPGLSSESARTLERGRIGPEVDPIDHGHEVEFGDSSPEEVADGC